MNTEANTVPMPGEQRNEPQPVSPTAAAVATVVATGVAASVAWALGQDGHTVLGVPAMIWCAALAFGIQWLAFVPAWVRRTEHFYDLTGSLTYISVLLFGLAMAPTVHLRSAVLSGLIMVWALRLGTFLFARVRRAGHDTRFVTLMANPVRFFMTWTLQGLWVFLTLAAALTCILSPAQPALGAVDGLGLALWAAGFGIEVVADRQKGRFRADPANRGKFITTGLWGWSRHPNYFGEILLWVGIALTASSAMQGWQWVGLISPLFVFVLLNYISGIPLLEEQAEQRWGGEPEYEAYKQSTPVLFLSPPQRRRQHA